MSCGGCGCCSKCGCQATCTCNRNIWSLESQNDSSNATNLTVADENDNHQNGASQGLSHFENEGGASPAAGMHLGVVRRNAAGE